MNPYRDSEILDQTPRTERRWLRIVALVSVLSIRFFPMHGTWKEIVPCVAIATIFVCGIVWWASPKQQARRRARIEAQADAWLRKHS